MPENQDRYYVAHQQDSSSWMVDAANGCVRLHYYLHTSDCQECLCCVVLLLDVLALTVPAEI